MITTNPTQPLITHMEDLKQRISQLEEELYGKSVTILRHSSSLSSLQESTPSPTLSTNDQELSSIPTPSSSSLLSHLTEEQLQKFQFVKTSLMEGTSEEHSWVNELDEQQKRYLLDDRSILRAFEGYGWNVNSANNVLKRVVTWRKNYNPHQIRMRDLKHVGPSGLVHLYGFDRCDRPILYINARNLNLSDNSDENVRLKFDFLLYGIEKSLYFLPPNQHRITWIFDMTNAPLSVSLVRKLRVMFEQLGDYYPELINVLMICNVSWTLNIVWKVVSSFISEHVLRRYFVFGSGETERFEKFLHEHVEPSVLLESIGGSISNPFQYDKIVELEELLDQFNKYIEQEEGEEEESIKEDEKKVEEETTSSKIEDDLD